MNPFTLLCRKPEFKQRLEATRLRLYRLAYSWTHDAMLADDLVQETLAKALKNARQLRDLELFDRWVFRILANCWRDHYRQAREMEDIELIELSCDAMPDRQHDQAETVRVVRDAIARLPVGQRQTLTLVDLEGFSYAEVAEILEIPIGTVMSRICRARATLKELLFEFAPEQGNGKPVKLRRIK